MFDSRRGKTSFILQGSNRKLPVACRGLGQKVVLEILATKWKKHTYVEVGNTLRLVALLVRLKYLH